jgi:YHS domain-containing protein
MEMIKMKINNRAFLLIALAIGIAIGFAACSSIKSEGVAKVNTDGKGQAVRGFDAVAYFAANSAVEGDPKYQYAWNGAKWLFANAENLEKFKQNPEAYAPQFGGYCAYAVSHGHTADGDPNAWKVVDGKLYLNYNPEVKQMWEKEQDKFIKDGEKNWTEFQTKKPEAKR